MRSNNYIPVTDENYNLFTRFDRPYWTPYRHVSVNKIKIDSSRMSFANSVCEDVVNTIIENFDIDNWLPVMMDNEGYLLDGQHRLEVARRLRLKFIDAIVQDTELLNKPVERKTRQTIFDKQPVSPIHRRKVTL
ncbi:MAG: hypothetical protein ACR2LC_17290 [Pyrinomonadaceae bacterium]